MPDIAVQSHDIGAAVRGDLAAILHEASRESTEHMFGDSIDGIEQSEAGVDVQFQNGGRRRFDLVAGADGLHSKVRSLRIRG